MLVGHREKRMMQLLIAEWVQARAERVFLVGFVQRQRHRVVTMGGSSGLRHLIGRSALSVRQLHCHAGEVADAVMAADEKVDGVFIFWLSSCWGNLVEHVGPLSRTKGIG